MTLSPPRLGRGVRYNLYAVYPLDPRGQLAQAAQRSFAFDVGEHPGTAGFRADLHVPDAEVRKRRIFFNGAFQLVFRGQIAPRTTDFSRHQLQNGHLQPFPYDARDDSRCEPDGKHVVHDSWVLVRIGVVGHRDHEKGPREPKHQHVGINWKHELASVPVNRIVSVPFVRLRFRGRRPFRDVPVLVAPDPPQIKSVALPQVSQGQPKCSAA